jgi:hypothetical protein
VLAHLTEAEVPILLTALALGLVGGAGVVAGWFFRGSREKQQERTR